MVNEISIFKKKAARIINQGEMKLWLAQKYSKRVEHLFNLGQEQFLPPQKIAEGKKYILFGQKITDNQNRQLKELFIKHIKV